MTGRDVPVETGCDRTNAKPSLVMSGFGRRSETPNRITGFRRLRHSAKQWLPSFLQTGWLAVEDMARSRLYRPGHLKLWLRDWLGHPAACESTERANDVCQRALLDWLGRAQDAVPDGGVAAYYGLADGWSA